MCVFFFFHTIGSFCFCIAIGSFSAFLYEKHAKKTFIFLIIMNFMRMKQLFTYVNKLKTKH